MERWALSLIALLLAGCTAPGLPAADVPPDNTPQIPPLPDAEQHPCSPESRDVDACIALYDPVCGWFNEDIRCIRYPCAATYSNSCAACADAKVTYWTSGECPG